MSMRILLDVSRGAPVTLRVDGAAVPAFEGETLATALLAAGKGVFRRDASGAPRGLYCNMGSCGECMVTVAGRRVRACVTDVAEGMAVATDG